LADHVQRSHRRGEIEPITVQAPLAHYRSAIELTVELTCVGAVELRIVLESSPRLAVVVGKLGSIRLIFTSQFWLGRSEDGRKVEECTQHGDETNEKENALLVFAKAI